MRVGKGSRRRGRGGKEDKEGVGVGKRRGRRGKGKKM